MSTVYTALTGKREDSICSRAYADMLRIAEKTTDMPLQTLLIGILNNV